MSKMSWETFKRRKKINEKEWIVKKGLTSYDEFCDELMKLGVRVPAESLKWKLFPNKRKKKQEKEEISKKTENAKIKRGRPRKHKGNSPVDQEDE